MSLQCKQTKTKAFTGKEIDELAKTASHGLK